MFYRHTDLQESYVHQCADAHKYNNNHLQEIARIQKHDAHTYFVIDNKIIHIKYCPYCGVDLATDETTQEFLKLKLK